MTVAERLVHLHPLQKHSISSMLCLDMGTTTTATVRANANSMGNHRVIVSGLHIPAEGANVFANCWLVIQLP